MVSCQISPELLFSGVGFGKIAFQIHFNFVGFLIVLDGTSDSSTGEAAEGGCGAG